MENIDLLSFIGETLDDVQKTLSEKGLNIIVEGFQTSKIKTDTKLVVLAKFINTNTVKLVVGDFLINL